MCLFVFWAADFTLKHIIRPQKVLRSVCWVCKTKLVFSHWVHCTIFFWLCLTFGFEHKSLFGALFMADSMVEIAFFFVTQWIFERIFGLQTERLSKFMGIIVIWNVNTWAKLPTSNVFFLHQLQIDCIFCMLLGSLINGNLNGSNLYRANFSW